MNRKHHSIVPLLLTVLTVALFGVAISLPTDSAEAQRATRTPRPTRESGSAVVMTPVATRDYAATVNALSTQVYQSVANLQATATAFVANFDLSDYLTDEQQALLDQWLSMYNVQYDAETGAITLTAGFTEAQFNAALDYAVELSTIYDPAKVYADFLPDLIRITFEDAYTAGQRVYDVVMDVTITVTPEGTLSYSITYNLAVPESLMTEYSAIIEELLAETFTESMTLEESFSYTWNDVTITDTTLYATVTAYLEQ